MQPQSTVRQRLLRLVAGLGVASLVTVLGFALLMPLIHGWGATDAEIARSMPGDELLDDPAVAWTHGETIRAEPAAVWPWIAQIGDDRGGFYSYTFIENLFVGSDLYHNANRILPEFQHPQPGDGLIFDYLQVTAVEPGRWLLASLGDGLGMGWTWLWHVAPSPADPMQTRLLVRMRVQPEAGVDNPLVGFVMDSGGFVMEKRMIQGIKDRAEGRMDAPYREAVEIVLWMVALAVGLVAGGLFVFRRHWLWPLLVGITSIGVLFLFTFVQPPLWGRVLVDASLVLALWWSATASRPSNAEAQRKRTEEGEKVILSF